MLKTRNCHGFADASGLTAVDISRYRTGKRTPDLSSPQLKKLAFGLAKLAQEHGKESITEGEIYNALTNALGKESLSYAITIERFNQIISLLDINISQCFCIHCAQLFRHCFKRVDR